LRMIGCWLARIESIFERKCWCAWSAPRVVYVQVRRNGAKRAHCLETPKCRRKCICSYVVFGFMCIMWICFELAKIHSTERVCYVDSFMFMFYSTLMFIICVNNPNQYDYTTDWILCYWFLCCWSWYCWSDTTTSRGYEPKFSRVSSAITLFCASCCLW
jgi:hypothetical protein